MPKLKVAPSVLVISHKNYRYVSANTREKPTETAQRQLRALEHSNNILQGLYIDQPSITAMDQFLFVEYPVDTLEAAHQRKRELVDEYRAQGLCVINKR